MNIRYTELSVWIINSNIKCKKKMYAKPYVTTCTLITEVLFKCQKRWANLTSYILHSTSVFQKFFTESVHQNMAEAKKKIKILTTFFQFQGIFANKRSSFFIRLKTICYLPDFLRLKNTRSIEFVMSVLSGGK